MRKEDRFYFFIFEAVSAPNISPSFYFCIHQKKNALYVKKSLDFNDQELPKLTFDEKMSFLIQYANTLESKNNYLKVLKDFKPCSNFSTNLVRKLRESRFEKLWDFDIAQGQFLKTSVNRLYSTYNLSPEMEIDFSEMQGGIE